MAEILKKASASQRELGKSDSLDGAGNNVLFGERGGEAVDCRDGCHRQSSVTPVDEMTSVAEISCCIRRPLKPG